MRVNYPKAFRKLLVGLEGFIGFTQRFLDVAAIYIKVHIFHTSCDLEESVRGLSGRERCGIGVVVQGEL